MLTTGKKGMTAQATIDYYTKDLANADYYLDDTVLSYWSGKLADKLGLSGEVERDDLFAVVKNRHPQTGEKLKPREHKNMRSSQDLTVSLGKDLSILRALTKDPEVKKDITDSVIAANDVMLKEMEKLVQVRTHKGLATKNIYTGNMLISSYLQSTTRPVNGFVTPQDHVHNLIKNITEIPKGAHWNGKGTPYRSADLRKIMDNRPYLQQVFHNELAKQLIDKGFPITRTEKGYHITGISREAIERFSLRTKQIEDFAKANNITDPKIKGGLGAKIRDGKKTALPKEQQIAYWNHILPDDTRKVIDNIRNDDSGTPHIPSGKALAHALEHHLQNDSKVDEKRLLATAMRYGVGSVSVDSLRAEYNNHDVLIDVHKGRRIVTVKSIWEEEETSKQIVRDGRWKFAAFAKQDFNIPDFFNKKQRSAVKRILKSTDLYTPLRGKAGTGKTTVLKAVADVIERKQEVVALAPTNSAKDNLKEDGLTHAHTVDMFLHSPKLQEQFKGQVMMLDEAGMVGFENFNKLMKIVDENNMRIIAVGDEKQHNSVPRGDAFRVLNKYAGVRPILLDENIRQQTEDHKKAVDALSRGNAEQGMKYLEKGNSIKKVPADNLHKSLAKEYIDSINTSQSTIVVSPTHKAKDKVTAEVRKLLKESGQISEEERIYQIHKVMHLSDAEKKDVRNYEAGQNIEVNQNMHGFTKGERLTVSHVIDDEVLVTNKDGTVKKLDIQHAKRFNLYEHKEEGFAKNDIIRITKGGTSIVDGKKTRFNNNSRYTITGYTPDGDFKLEGGRILSKEFGNIDHGIAITSHSSQGLTYDQGIIDMSDDTKGKASNMEQFYVSVSRSRYGVSVYTSDKKELLEQVKKSNERKSATEIFKERHKFWSDKLQEVIDQYRRTQAYLQHMSRNDRGIEPSR
ncbi:MobF family relaxase [Seonamhaeicola marinus]|uniref:Relaxase domain-containing protein n=1 Tax=Seonamhaeicola marinus TaxID=1912246 RepID=A0A5D0HU41_9FLAO|nr:MobF family relaxase [Seonamhaeicola marinus]TYA74913.1 relaxase domain-containing protein [Seonamhaeicola marinus]